MVGLYIVRYSSAAGVLLICAGMVGGWAAKKLKLLTTTWDTLARADASTREYIKLAIVEVDYRAALYCPGISSKSLVAIHWPEAWRLIRRAGGRGSIILPAYV